MAICLAMLGGGGVVDVMRKLLSVLLVGNPHACAPRADLGAYSQNIRCGGGNFCGKHDKGACRMQM